MIACTLAAFRDVIIEIQSGVISTPIESLTTILQDLVDQDPQEMPGHTPNRDRYIAFRLADLTGSAVSVLTPDPDDTAHPGRIY